MIGDARARGKRHSTRAHGPEFKEKLSRGQAHKHVVEKGDSDGGGWKEVMHSAERAHRGGPRHGGKKSHDKQAPHKQRERIENKHVDQGQILDEWCRGKRGHYR
jgi:hypothetical protein